MKPALLAIVAGAGRFAAVLSHSPAARLNAAAIVGILAMAAGAWVLCGAGYALATFGGFTWLTTIVAAELSRPVAKGGD